ncbi:MAG: hypothetical protein ACI9Y1_003702 [Lentisphaeria bacterium]
MIVLFPRFPPLGAVRHQPSKVLIEIDSSVLVGCCPTTLNNSGHWHGIDVVGGSRQSGHKLRGLFLVLTEIKNAIK